MYELNSVLNNLQGLICRKTYQLLGQIHDFLKIFWTKFHEAMIWNKFKIQMYRKLKRTRQPFGLEKIICKTRGWLNQQG